MSGPLIRVANTGQIVAAGSTIPVLTPSQSTLTTFASPWVNLGSFNEDGVEHEMSEDTEEIRTWQEGLVRIIVKGRTLTLKTGVLNSSRAVIEQYYGGTFVLTGTSPNQVAKLDISNTQARPSGKFVFEWLDGATGSIWRMVFPNGQVGEVESPKFNAQGAVEWGMTITSLGGSAASVIGYWETNDEDVLLALA